MSATVPTGDAELRAQALAALKRKRKFLDDAGAFVAINAILWLVWALTDRSAGGGLPWPAWVSIVWAFLLALDGWRTYGRLRRPITESDIDAELRRLER